MGNYRQHITFASTLGVAYGAGAYVFLGVHWVYGSVAALLTSLGGLLPDLDSASGTEIKGFTGILGVLAALAAWQKFGQYNPPPAFEFHLWSVVLAFILVRHGLRRLMVRIAVHRGISHSLPTCAVWGALTYLHYPSENHALRVTMCAAVILGFLSHLLLDEICSVDLKGARVNKAFGTALKFWAPSPWSTIATYAVLSYLTYQIVQTWPENLYSFLPPAPPSMPFKIPDKLDLRSLTPLSATPPSSFRR